METEDSSLSDDELRRRRSTRFVEDVSLINDIEEEIQPNNNV